MEWYEALLLGIIQVASYSAIANDSIQTIGTFIASNSDKKWYYLWIYMGGIFLITVTYSWYNYGGDISYGRLASKGLNDAPDNFKFLQVFAPVALLIMTRFKMPVSTSILLLSAFATQASSITSILSKSFFGYFIAFFIAMLVWILTTNIFEKFKNSKPSRIWLPLQWVSSGALWSAWIMQDMANVAVVLPRSLNYDQFIVVASFIFFGLGLLFYLRGDRIQQIVLEIIRKEKLRGTLRGVIVQLGGQTPLKLAKDLQKQGVPILGTSPDSIDLAEDRDRFRKLLNKLKWEVGLEVKSIFEPIKKKAEDVFELMKYEDPRSEAETLLLILEGVMSKVILTKFESKLIVLDNLIKKYNV